MGPAREQFQTIDNFGRVARLGQDAPPHCDDRVTRKGKTARTVNVKRLFARQAFGQRSGRLIF